MLLAGWKGRETGSNFEQLGKFHRINAAAATKHNPIRFECRQLELAGRLVRRQNEKDKDGGHDNRYYPWLCTLE